MPCNQFIETHDRASAIVVLVLNIIIANSHRNKLVVSI
jgi:hypothetical protein